MKQTSKNFFNLKNKIIIIAGGSGFLGSEFSSTLSDVGAIPIILDKNNASLELLKKKFIKKYRKIDCLIYVAGFTGQDMLKTNSNFFEKFENYDFCSSNKIRFRR